MRAPISRRRRVATPRAYRKYTPPVVGGKELFQYQMSPLADCRRGQSLVVWAIHEGRQAAREIDFDLMVCSMIFCDNLTTHFDAGKNLAGRTGRSRTGANCQYQRRDVNKRMEAVYCAGDTAIDPIHAGTSTPNSDSTAENSTEVPPIGVQCSGVQLVHNS